ncbi:MAG: hypothetical protein M3237_04415 [Actinomycetota bacterium]|nr:hypothetical protein [Actinomycetota bacterium]
MHDRAALGPAEVSDAELTTMVASLLGHDPSEVSLLDSLAERVAYDLPAITTAGRYWVSGTARTPAGDTTYRMFVKHIQAWHHSPLFQQLPPELREAAAAMVPWRTEHLAYRSDLGDRLPEGLSMPRAVGVFELPDDAVVVWLEEVAHPPVPWDLARYRRAARLLGRMAASPRVAVLGNVGETDFTVRDYFTGRLGHQVLPLLRDDGIWHHPLLAATFDTELRDRLRAAADRAEAYVDELLSLPQANAHGDASPNNLLPGPTPDSFVLIDYGFWVRETVGFDISQLVVGDIQIGKRSVADLPELDAACTSAYTAGLHEEGLDIEEAVVARSHALQLLIFTGLSTLPVELLDEPPTPRVEELAASRAALARFSLDLVQATGG